MQNRYDKMVMNRVGDLGEIGGLHLSNKKYTLCALKEANSAKQSNVYPRIGAILAPKRSLQIRDRDLMLRRDSPTVFIIELSAWLDIVEPES